MNHTVDLWSSVELGAFLPGLVHGLDGTGWTARHRFAVTEERYRRARSAADRAAVRWSSYVAYPRQLHRELRQEKTPGVAVVCTNTFYAPAVAMRAARGRVPVVNWMFDLFPDVLVAGQKIDAGGALDRRLGALTRWTFSQAAANVFLGERLLAFAEARYGPIPRSYVIPVGADAGALGNDAPPAHRGSGPLRVLYCGNLGHMHDTRTVAAVLRDAAPAGWTMEFRGHGAGYRKLAAAAQGGQATFGGSLSGQEWARVMREADVALVTMKSGAEGLVMPSKTYSAMMAGQAILAVCPPESDLADTVRRDDVGWVVAPGDSEGLAAVLRAAAVDPSQVLAKRRNAFRAARERYDQRVLAARWAELLRTLVD